ncbi:hypothetical protein BpJC7_09520 [Weizmannia acidilactici]|uniref:Uncharacterized protein n=1 Tax=Weizmannia acidilactici TaxID=2607726 RepID=A0A5J4JE53_9BACI|nr:hypothetical protein [Weizmannia acidilactici]GER67139.1 hypothetical protein BpJC4_16100 [Weizmannia acidilactici]GER69649.1 hypothetical protein BpJC7_09520 [Weizmannia acidilactici]GER72530.1 hypothetical protein BpPP18_05970 [Weizmannia acidilactici]
MSSLSQVYKLLLGLTELFFGIPFLGGAIILAHLWAPLGGLILLHIVGAVFAYAGGKAVWGHVFGIIGNVLAFIPVLGMILHICIGLTVFTQGLRNT